MRTTSIKESYAILICFDINYLLLFKCLHYLDDERGNMQECCILGGAVWGCVYLRVHWLFTGTTSCRPTRLISPQRIPLDDRHVMS